MNETEYEEFEVDEVTAEHVGLECLPSRDTAWRKILECSKNYFTVALPGENPGIRAHVRKARGWILRCPKPKKETVRFWRYQINAAKSWNLASRAFSTAEVARDYYNWGDGVKFEPFGEPFEE